jgi:hypothetical protein
MSDFRSMLVNEVVGAGHATEDAVPTPKQFRGIPMPIGGVPPATPAGARVLTGSPASTIPQPA